MRCGAPTRLDSLTPVGFFFSTSILRRLPPLSVGRRSILSRCIGHRRGRGDRRDDDSRASPPQSAAGRRLRTRASRGTMGTREPCSRPSGWAPAHLGLLPVLGHPRASVYVHHLSVRWDPRLGEPSECPWPQTLPPPAGGRPPRALTRTCRPAGRGFGARRGTLPRSASRRTMAIDSALRLGSHHLLRAHQITLTETLGVHALASAHVCLML